MTWLGRLAHWLRARRRARAWKRWGWCAECGAANMRYGGQHWITCSRRE